MLCAGTEPEDHYTITHLEKGGGGGGGGGVDNLTLRE